MPYAIVPGVLVLVDGSAADRAAGNAVRFELPGKVKKTTRYTKSSLPAVSPVIKAIVTLR